MHPRLCSCPTRLTVEPEHNADIQAFTVEAFRDSCVIGRLRGFILHYQNIEAVAEMANLLHEDLREAVRAVRFAMAATHDAPILYVDVLLVSPASRGLGLAKQLLERAWLHRNCHASLLRPCPLQYYLDWLSPEDRQLVGNVRTGTQNERRSLNNLKNFYQKIGYTPLNCNGFWWRALPHDFFDFADTNNAVAYHVPKADKIK
jgi:GNAT superfamily N-acetyltransferase